MLNDEMLRLKLNEDSTNLVASKFNTVYTIYFFY